MKRNVILGLVGLLAVSWLAAVNDMVSIPKKIKEHIAKAEVLEEKQIYVDAVDEYQGALEYEPDDVELSMKMAEIRHEILLAFSIFRLFPVLVRCGWKG